MMHFKDQIKTIIWDWNGTLLNDVDICISCMNKMLLERNLPPLDRQQYLEIFTFPVKEYYLKAGFDFEKEDFEIPAHQFIDLYRKEVLNSQLHESATEVLGYLQSRGYMQVILSAMERDFLIQTMQDKEIITFFRAIFGIDNHLGAGKSIAAKELMDKVGSHPSDTVIFGDTLHDAEVARELGIDCILIARGHQSFERLEKTGFKVLHDIREITAIF